MHIAEVVTIAKSLPLLRLNTYKSLILSYSADYRRIFRKNSWKGKHVISKMGGNVFRFPPILVYFCCGENIRSMISASLKNFLANFCTSFGWMEATRVSMFFGSFRFTPVL